MSKVVNIISQMRPEVLLMLIFFTSALAVVLSSFLLLRVIRRVIGERGRRLADSLRLPLVLFAMAAGAAIVVRFPAGIDISDYAGVITDLSKATAVIAVAMFLDRLLRGLVRMHSDSTILLRTSMGVINFLIRAVIYSLCLLMILDLAGVPITPILASLGIGSLAVALALQPSLENFFSGLQIISDRTVATGHYIRLEGGEEGFIEKIGWRSTYIRQLSENIVIVPNKQMVNARIINFNYPSEDLVITQDVGVHYKTDLEHAERVAIATAVDVMKNVPGGVPGYAPCVRYTAFGDFAINMMVVMMADKYENHRQVKHEFIKRLHRNFAREGIIIPYPIRTLELSSETAGVLRGDGRAAQAERG